jgi:hypothetical protein
LALPVTGLRILESVHGHLGILAVAALLHPAIVLRKGLPLSFGAKWACVLATSVAVLAFATGLSIYGSYREIVKRPLLLDQLDVGLLFETKEHVAWGVMTMAVGALVAALAAPREAVSQRRAAALVYAAACLLALCAAGLGTYVAAVRGFPE